MSQRYTFHPLVHLPDAAFETFPFVLTVEGQYIVKNLVIIGAVREQADESAEAN